jgi:hypothetical protein
LPGRTRRPEAATDFDFQASAFGQNAHCSSIGDLNARLIAAEVPETRTVYLPGEDYDAFLDRSD